MSNISMSDAELWKKSQKLRKYFSLPWKCKMYGMQTMQNMLRSSHG